MLEGSPEPNTAGEKAMDQKRKISIGRDFHLEQGKNNAEHFQHRMTRMMDEISRLFEMDPEGRQGHVDFASVGTSLTIMEAVVVELESAVADTRFDVRQTEADVAVVRFVDSLS
jgi:hypothetical protein